MKKVYLNDKLLLESVPIAITETSRIMKLQNGDILKLYNPDFITLNKTIGIDIKEKILTADQRKHSPEILVPTSVVHTIDNRFCGYIMPCAKGENFNSYDRKLTDDDRKNLSKYAEVHNRLESVLKRNSNIVFPDFCTCDNIFIDSRGNIQLIDYDGLQVEKQRTLSVSTSVGEVDELLKNRKYCTCEGLFKKELDKKSSIILFYLTAFNINLNKVGVINPYTNKAVTLDDIFEYLNLDDPDICHKTYKIFQDDQNNEYLEKDIFNLAEKYDMQIIGNNGNIYNKKLIKKK